MILIEKYFSYSLSLVSSLKQNIKSLLIKLKFKIKNHATVCYHPHYHPTYPSNHSGSDFNYLKNARISSWKASKNHNIPPRLICSQTNQTKYLDIIPRPHHNLNHSFLPVCIHKVQCHSFFGTSMPLHNQING